MVRKKSPTFEKYRDEANAGAPFEGIGLSLGITEHKAAAKIRDTVSAKIDRVLKQELEHDTALNLRNLLIADIAPFLRKDKAPYSMIDLQTLGLTDPPHIRRFLRNHDIDLDTPADFSYAQEVLEESIKFYDEVIAHERGKKKPAKLHNILRKINTPENIYNLFKIAAGQCNGHKMLIPQACGLLRIASATNFIKKDPLIKLIPQVEGEYNNIIRRHVRKEGKLYTYHSGDEEDPPIPLVSFVFRTKEPNRTKIKLLHKPSNLTNEVLDHIGFRFVTQNPADTLRLIYKMLFDPDYAVLPFTNIRIGETKQSMLDPMVIAEALNDPKKASKLFANLAVDTIDHQELENRGMGSDDNPHSSAHYRAIHITVDLPVLDGGVHRLFPIEIQFLDIGSWVNNESKASHFDYVETQENIVVERVLGNNLYVNFEEQRKKPKSKK